MVNVKITWNRVLPTGYAVCIDGNFPIQVREILIYKKSMSRVLFHFPIMNLRDLQFTINAESVKVNIRRKIDFERNEVFAFKEKGKSEYSLYIPCELIDCHYMGMTSYPMSDDFIYDYDVYHINVTNIDLSVFTEGVRSLTKRDENTIEVLDYAHSKPTKERAKAEKICGEIKANCNVEIAAYDMLKILRKYNITRKRGDAR